MVRFTPRQLYPGTTGPGTHIIGGWVGLRCGLKACSGDESLSKPRIEPRFPAYCACVLGTKLTELCQLPISIIKALKWRRWMERGGTRGKLAVNIKKWIHAFPCKMITTDTILEGEENIILEHISKKWAINALTISNELNTGSNFTHPFDHFNCWFLD